MSRLFLILYDFLRFYSIYFAYKKRNPTQRAGWNWSFIPDIIPCKKSAYSLYCKGFPLYFKHNLLRLCTKKDPVPKELPKHRIRIMYFCIEWFFMILFEHYEKASISWMSCSRTSDRCSEENLSEMIQSTALIPQKRQNAEAENLSWSVIRIIWPAAWMISCLMAASSVVLVQSPVSRLIASQPRNALCAWWFR